jgi:hypothetical protein
MMCFRGTDRWQAKHQRRPAGSIGRISRSNASVLLPKV